MHQPAGAADGAMTQPVGFLRSSAHTWLFVAGWTLACIVSFGAISAELHNFPVTSGIAPESTRFNDFDSGAALFGMLLGGLPATLIGLWQWLALRRPVRMRRLWILTPTVGIGLQHFLQDGFPDASDMTFAVVVGALAAGLTQWALLRRIAPISIAWPITSAASWVIGWVLGVLLLGAFGIRDVRWTPDIGLQQHGLLGATVGATHGLATAVMLIAAMRAKQKAIA